MHYGKLKNRPFSIIIVTGDFMKTIFKNCTLLDGTKDMAARENIDVAIENGKIAEIGSITPSVLAGPPMAPANAVAIPSPISVL